MPPQPIYTPVNVNDPAYHLRYTWSGWPSSEPFPDLPDNLLGSLETPWEADGLRLLEHRWLPRVLQFTFSVKPSVAPTFFTARVKGRLQYALRKCGRPVAFNRKVAFRTIGDNSTKEVEAYIARQVEREPLADPRFAELLREFTVTSPLVDLSLPSETHSGRYWYNLHLVLVVEQRGRLSDPRDLALMRDQSFRIAEKKQYAISALSVMPDHLHLALRGNIEHSPQEIALTFLNNLAYSLGQKALWGFGYYTGTFGEYDMGAVRPSRWVGAER
jgi:REP element-mobilizing transposase RayT